MTSSSPTPSTTTVPSLLAAPISEKLTKGNFLLWSAQVLPAIHAAQLEDLLLGAEKAPDKELTVVIDGKSEQQCNPAYTAWVARDQAVLGYIMSTLTREMLLHVSRCPTSTRRRCARGPSTRGSPSPRRKRTNCW
jgi:hypothetical protein